MVWAAVFGGEMRKVFLSISVSIAHEDAVEEWETNQAVRAAELACAVVSKMRDAERNCIKEWGNNSDVTEMLQNMLGKTPT